MAALACGGHTEAEFEPSGLLKKDRLYRCLLANACTNRIVGHIGECYKRTAIGATDKVRCRCVEAPVSDGIPRIRLAPFFMREDNTDEMNASNARGMKMVLEWIFARVAHEAKVELGMIGHTQKATMYRMRRYIQKKRSGAVDLDPWPIPSLDGTLHWGEYRRLFLETLVRHMITHVLDSHMQSTGDHADMIASMMVSASSAYDAMLRERKAHSVQMHKGRLGVVFDYSELDLSKNLRTKDMSDDEYGVESALLGDDKQKILASNARKILLFWASHCSECTRGAKRKDVESGGAEGSDGAEEESAIARATRTEAHRKLVTAIRDGVDKLEPGDRRGINMVRALITALRDICDLVKRCTREIKESDIKNRNERRKNPGEQNRRAIVLTGDELHPACAKSREANTLILKAMEYVIKLLRETGVTVSVDQEQDATLRVELREPFQVDLAYVIGDVMRLNVSNKLTGLSLKRQKSEASTSRVPDVGVLVMRALVNRARGTPDAPADESALWNKKPRDVLERALVYLLAKRPMAATDQGRAEFTSRRGKYRQALDDAEQCTVKGGVDDDREHPACARCDARKHIVRNRQRFARGRYGDDEPAIGDAANARDLVLVMEKGFVEDAASGPPMTLAQFLCEEARLWMHAVKSAPASDICLCATQCSAAGCDKWREMWTAEEGRWFSLEGGAYDVRDVAAIKIAQQQSSIASSWAHQTGLVWRFLKMWGVVQADADEADEAGEAGEAGQTGARRARGSGRSKEARDEARRKKREEARKKKEEEARKKKEAEEAAKKAAKSAEEREKKRQSLSALSAICDKVAAENPAIFMDTLQLEGSTAIQLEVVMSHLARVGKVKQSRVSAEVVDEKTGTVRITLPSIAVTRILADPADLLGKTLEALVRNATDVSQDLHSMNRVDLRKLGISFSKRNDHMITKGDAKIADIAEAAKAKGSGKMDSEVELDMYECDDMGNCDDEPDRALLVRSKLGDYVRSLADFNRIGFELDQADDRERKSRKKVVFASAYAVCRQIDSTRVTTDGEVRGRTAQTEEEDPELATDISLWVVARTSRGGIVGKPDHVTKAAFLLVSMSPDFLFQRDFYFPIDLARVTENALAHVALNFDDTAEQVEITRERRNAENGRLYGSSVAEILYRLVRTPRHFDELNEAAKKQVEKDCVDILNDIDEHAKQATKEENDRISREREDLAARKRTVLDGFRAQINHEREQARHVRDQALLDMINSRIQDITGREAQARRDLEEEERALMNPKPTRVRMTMSYMVAMWVVAARGSASVSNEQKQRAAFYFYHCLQDESVLSYKEILDDAGRVAVDQMGRESRFIRSRLTARVFGSGDMHAIAILSSRSREEEQYLLDMTPLGDKRVPLDVFGTGVLDDIERLRMDDPIVMILDGGSMSPEDVARSVWAKEKYLGPDPNVVIKNEHKKHIEANRGRGENVFATYMRHVESGRSFVYTRKPLADTIHNLSTVYYEVIKELETHRQIRDGRVVRLIPILPGVEFEREMTVIALYDVFHGYRSHVGPIRLRYELHIGKGREETDAYKNAIRDVVWPANLQYMNKLVHGQIDPPRQRAQSSASSSGMRQPIRAFHSNSSSNSRGDINSRRSAPAKRGSGAATGDSGKGNRHQLEQPRPREPRPREAEASMPMQSAEMSDTDPLPSDDGDSGENGGGLEPTELHELPLGRPSEADLPDLPDEAGWIDAIARPGDTVDHPDLMEEDGTVGHLDEKGEGEEDADAVEWAKNVWKNSDENPNDEENTNKISELSELLDNITETGNETEVAIDGPDAYMSTDDAPFGSTGQDNPIDRILSDLARYTEEANSFGARGSVSSGSSRSRWGKWI